MKFAKTKNQKRWCLFQATDFHSMMYPCIFFCHVLGLYPCKISSFNNFVFSRIRYAYATIMIVTYVCLCLMIFYHLNISGRIEYDSIPGMLQANFYLFLGAVITVVTYLLSRSRIQLFQSVVEVSASLPAEAFSRMARWIHVKDLVFCLFLVVHLPNTFTQDPYDTLSKIVLLYTTLVIFIMDMVYVNCVCVLTACFERINKSLKNLREVLITDEPHLLRRVYHEQKNPLLLIELRTLKKQHLMISDVIEALNVTFSLQMITTVVLTFSEVTFSLYFYILQQYGMQKINLEKQFWYSYFITSVALYSIKLIIMVLACEMGKDQALEIGTNIHEVLINTSNKQIKDELEIFSLQVLHRENVFSARGLTMDATLLTRIAGGITTYLLILIQFLMSNPSN